MKLLNRQAKQICAKFGENLVNFEFLAKGNHNSNYLLGTECGKYVVRVEDNLQFKNLKKEFIFLKNAPQGLGPRVFFFDNSHKILAADYFVEEYLRGTHPSQKKPHDAFVIQMAHWLKKLHSTRKKVSKVPKPRAGVEPYYQNYLKYRHNLQNAADQAKLNQLVEHGLAMLDKHQNLFTRRHHLSLLHNDTSSENIFYQSGSVRLIDWEFVGYGLPERELAYFLDSYNLTSKQRKLFLQSYGFPETKTAQVRLKIAYVTLLFSSIGYSLWQLDILNRHKRAPAREKKERMARLKRDIRVLSGMIIS